MNISEYNGVWVFAEQRNGELQKVSLEILGEGRRLADELGVKLTAVLLGNNVACLADILGEHGDSSFVPWNHAYVGCKKISDVMKDNNHPMDDLEKIHKDVVNAAYEIINKKKATYYGIGVALSRLVKAILEDEHGILTVSAYLKDGEYGQDDIYIGVPAIICSDGIREVVNLDLTDEEQAKLNESCKIIKEMRANSIEKIINE